MSWQSLDRRKAAAATEAHVLCKTAGMSRLDTHVLCKKGGKTGA